jgi:hypothetical protein
MMNDKGLLSIDDLSEDKVESFKDLEDIDLLESKTDNTKS